MLKSIKKIPSVSRKVACQGTQLAAETFRQFQNFEYLWVSHQMEIEMLLIGF